MSLNAISRAPEIYNLFISSVETNLSLNDILQAMRMASSVLSEPARVKRFAIGIDQVTPNITDLGASILLPDYNAIWEVVRDAVYSP